MVKETATDQALDHGDSTLDAYLPAAESAASVEVYLQTLAPVESKHSQDTLLTTLTDLHEEDYLRDISVIVWGKRICPESVVSTVDGGKQIVEKIGDFYALAADSELSISPFFRTKTVDSSITGESFQSIVPPSRCLALYEGTALVGVFPCLIDGDSYTFEDAINRLDSRAVRQKAEQSSL